MRICRVAETQVTADKTPLFSEWAGRWVTEENVQNACGDERDWFTYEMRHKAYDDAWSRYYWSDKRKRNRGSKFKFAQIMIIT